MDDAEQFMWINKSASSSHLSRCDNAESAAINSFVQSKLNQVCGERSSKPYRPRASSGDFACHEATSIQNSDITSLTQSNLSKKVACYQRREHAELGHTYDGSKSAPTVSVELEKSSAKLIDIGLPDLEDLENQSIRNDANVRDILGFFKTFVPSEAQLLDLSLGRFRDYAAILLYWSLHHDDVFLGLTLSYHCHVLRNHSSSAFTKCGIEALRSRFLQKVDARLESGTVDDVLIQVIVLAIAIDRCLGHKQFIAAHVKALDLGVALRGGLIEVGRSRPGLDDSLCLSVIAALFDAGTVCGSTGARPVNRILPQVFSKLPKGMQALATEGYFSTNMIKALLSFEDWYSDPEMQPQSTTRIWSHAVSASLTVIEMCVLIALVCIADDLANKGDCMRTLLWRDSHRLADNLLNCAELWANDQLGDLLIWLISVIATPKKQELVPFKAQSELQQRIICLRPELRYQNIIEKRLRRYFCPQTSLELWKYAWMIEFQSL